MLTILEGPDGAGKTTLANYLADNSDRPILHSPGLTNGRDEMIAWVLRILSSPDRERFILDRFPLVSELVYGPALRGNAQLTADHSLYSAWYHTPALLVYCRPPYDVIEQEAKEKESEKLMAELPRVVRAYDNLMAKLLSANLKEKTQVSVVTYDFTVDSMETLLELTTQKRDEGMFEYGYQYDNFRQLKREIRR